MARLEVELVPATAWYANVRTLVPRRDWVICKRVTAEAAGHRCEVCGGQGARWPVECHEVWEYNDERHIQTLVRLIALCPSCHEVKHYGLAELRGHAPRALAHLCRVNGWREDDATHYLAVCFEIWSLRSRFEWDLDCSFLATIGVDVPVKPR